LPFATISLVLTHYLLFSNVLSDSIYGSFWLEETSGQATAGSFQDHEKATTVDSIGVRLNFFTGIPGKTSTKL
jgi:hypothetical protein